MKTPVVLSILGSLVLIGIASITFTNERISTTQNTHRSDVVRIEDTQKRHIEQIAVVETKIDGVQRTLNRIERILNNEDKDYGRDGDER